MKKILYTLAAVAAIAFTASCNKEAEMGAVRDGDTINATFTIDLPAQVATKAISDGLTAKNLLFYVYDENGKYLENLTQTDKKFENKQTTVSVQLVKGLKYSFGFIAVADDNASGAYAFDPKTKTLTVDYTKMSANDDQFDLFTAALNDYVVTGPFKETVTLHRPLAQVNVGTTDDDIKAAKATGIKTDEMQTSLTFSEVSSVMNFLTGEVSEPKQNVTVKAKVRPLAPAEQLVVADEKYEWIAMAYVLTGTDKALTDVTLDAAISNEAGSMTPLRRQVANAPIQRNHRTNIIGNIFSVTGEFTIIIDEVYDTPDYDYTNTLQLAFFKGGEVTLEKDEVIEHQLVVPNGSDVILNLNGHKISNEKDLWDDTDGIDAWSLISVQGGSLTIKGEGKLDAKENDCYALDVRDGGSLIVEGGEYVGNISAVYVLEGKADIRGGKFDLKQLMTDQSGEGQYRFMVNLLDANRTNKTASAVISGGTFHMFNPGNNAAEGAGTNFLAAGYEATQDGDWYTVSKISVPGATYDGTRYETIEAAFAAALAASDNSPVIELGKGTYAPGYDFAFENPSVQMNVTVKAEDGLQPEQVVISTRLAMSASSAQKVKTGSSLTVKGVSFTESTTTNTKNDATHYYRSGSEASSLYIFGGITLTVEDCVFNLNDTAGKATGIVSWGDAATKLIVKNSIFNCNTYCKPMQVGNGDNEITGCVFNSPKKYAVQVNHYSAGDHGKLVMKDCSFTNSKFCLALDKRQEAYYNLDITLSNNTKDVTGILYAHSDDPAIWNTVVINGKDVPDYTEAELTEMGWGIYLP